MYVLYCDDSYIALRNVVIFFTQPCCIIKRCYIVVADVLFFEGCYVVVAVTLRVNVGVILLSL